MTENEISTEQRILKAAETVFLKKGFAGAKTTEIAKEAGVNHAMLHYYFRNKENLFDTVFQKQANLLANSFLHTFEENLPFLEKIRKGIEDHFNLIAQNPKLPFFIFNEILNDDKRKEIFFAALLPKAAIILSKLQNTIDEEAGKGSIKPTLAIDLMMNIMALNTFVFMAQPVISRITHNKEPDFNRILEQRKVNNVNLILSSLKVC